MTLPDVFEAVELATLASLSSGSCSLKIDILAKRDVINIDGVSNFRMFISIQRIIAETKP